MTDDSSFATDRPENSWLMRLKTRLLPTVPDFYGMLIAQCAVTAEGTSRLLAFLKAGEPQLAMEVRRLEHEGDRLKQRNLEALHRSFATPMDREDFYDAVTAIDEILNYAKTSVRELEMLQVSSDAHMVEMASQVDAGAGFLLAGFRQLQKQPDAADQSAEKARKTERAVEKAYRRSLADLFDPGRQLERIQGLNSAGTSPAELDQRSHDTLVVVTQMLKRREIYRHLSNSGDHVAHAAQILQDIVNKAT